MDSSPSRSADSTLLDALPCGVLRVDARGHVTYLNRAASAITGWTSANASGRLCREILGTNECLMLGCCDRAGDERERTISIRRRDGTPALVALQLRIADDAGSVASFELIERPGPESRAIASLPDNPFFVGSSERMKTLALRMARIARSPSNVLIQGDPGTGKELVARTMHGLGPRANKPFVAVNCGAIPETLIESEFFGHERGAFTDARGSRKGSFRRAEGGTIFLDEVGELSLAGQVKLLRAIQEKEITPLGGEPVAVDVRIMAATNRRLEEEVAAERFRRDLFYRLDIVRVELPSLEKRKVDIPGLVERFIAKFNVSHGRRIRSVSERAFAVLSAHQYEGNIRELENAIEHAFVLCTGDVIEVEDLPGHIGKEDVPSCSLLDQEEAKLIAEVLSACGGNRSDAARRLGVSRTTLWRKMRRYGLNEG